MLFADIHTHTDYSHGKNTPEEMVRAAIAKGLTRFAVSEHGPAHLFFGVKQEKLLNLRREMDRLQDVYGHLIQIEMGLEANLTGDGQTDIPKDVSLFDFVLLGYHRGVWPVDRASLRWAFAFSKNKGGEGAKKNAQCYVHAMQNAKKLLAITHPGTYIPVDIPLLARAARDYGILLEINEAHRNFSTQDLLAAKAEEARFLISSDAHRDERVGECGFSVTLAKEAGVLEQVENYRIVPVTLF